MPLPYRYRHLRGRYLHHNQSVPWWRYNPQAQPRQPRHYTAMCVRMCDGYYWPVSNRARRGKFYELSQRCRNSCNGEAKLFYMPSVNGDVKRMTDLSGRAYEHIDTAFLYRKKLVKSCTCKPMPWSFSARARHMQYAAEEAEKRARRQRDALRVAATPLEQRGTRKAGRTIIESLDERVDGRNTPHTSAVQDTEQGVDLAAPGETDSAVTGRQKDSAVAARTRVAPARNPRRASRRIRPRRGRHHGVLRVRRIKPKVSWGSGYGAGSAKYVGSGRRPQRR